MPLCGECLDHFIPDDYLDLCNSCGGQLLRQFEAMQEFRAGVMTIAELAAWATFGRSESVERCWRVG